MVFSMTAFARHTHTGVAGRYTWELRSVNHRYAEVFIRMPEDFRALESELRTTLLDRVKRGKFDCNLRVEPSDVETGALLVNEVAARAVIAACKQLDELGDGLGSVNAMQILQWPGVLEAQEIDSQQVSSEIRRGFAVTVDQLIDTRQREGGQLQLALTSRCDGVAAQIEELRSRVPEIIASLRERYRQRIQEFSGDLDNQRIEQECALLMQKLDVDEELDRLDAHLVEVRRVLRAGSPAGRRLDFLMQELNREANTIGAKSAHIDSSGAAIELKVLIEQMREQIQNIE